MIGNLGKVAYSPIPHNDGNNGNGGNITHKPMPILDQHNERLFPAHENSSGTVGTQEEPSTVVPDVPSPQVSIGNNYTDKINLVKKILSVTVPDVPGVPAKNSETANKPLACYWCKSTDLWLLNMPGEIWRCRRCHPPAPGAERKPNKT